MSHKIGDIAIAIVILVFVVGGISMFVSSADSTTNVDSGIVGEHLASLNNNLSSADELETGLTSKTDSTSSMTIEDSTSELEQRGSDAGGFINLISKNIITQFVIKLNEKIPGVSYVLGFFLTLIGIVISILLLRFFWGDNKV